MDTVISPEPPETDEVDVPFAHNCAGLPSLGGSGMIEKEFNDTPLLPQSDTLEPPSWRAPRNAAAKRTPTTKPQIQRRREINKQHGK